MGVQIGGIDLTDSIINAEFRLAVLEQVVDRLIKVAPIGTISPQDIEKMRDEAIKTISTKYPQAGIRKK